MDLRGKRIWITGASSGLGHALAKEAANRGAELVLSARSRAKLIRLAKSLPGSADAQVVALDLTEPKTFPDAVKAAGRIDILVNNGGISQRGTALDTEMDVVRKVMETNFFGHVALTKLVAPQMVDQGSGHIVVTSSVVGHLGTPMRSTYAASKHALHGYFDSLRYELHQHGVGVTIVCPGYIHTDISLNAVTGDGSPQGTMDSNQATGMKPKVFATKAWDGIEAGKPELYIGGKEEVAGIYLKRLFPRLLDRIVLRRRWDGDGQG